MEGWEVVIREVVEAYASRSLHKDGFLHGDLVELTGFGAHIMAMNVFADADLDVTDKKVEENLSVLQARARRLSMEAHPLLTMALPRLARSGAELHATMARLWAIHQEMLNILRESCTLAGSDLSRYSALLD